MLSSRWEVGGDFAVGAPASGPFVPLPENVRWYSLGRHAIAALSAGSMSKIWLPCYFCADVKGTCADHFNVERYCDHPNEEHPRWDTLRPAKSDYVLAVNYFGMRDKKLWQQWRGRNECVLIEDHSHDPFSAWARSSEAEYAFASLRKTIAVPDGAILWSVKRELPVQLPLGSSPGAAAKLSAMVLKRDYLERPDQESLKPEYRSLQIRGEKLFEQEKPSNASDFTRIFLRNGIALSWLTQREQNVQTLLRAARFSEGVKPLFDTWPKGATPYGLVLRFDNPAERNRWRDRLREDNVYCPVHWDEQDGCDEATRLSERILTVPADQRYNLTNVEILVERLSSCSMISRGAAANG
jgi:hypothetical protein